MNRAADVAYNHQLFMDVCGTAGAINRIVRVIAMFPIELSYTHIYIVKYPLKFITYVSYTYQTGVNTYYRKEIDDELML